MTKTKQQLTTTNSLFIFSVAVNHGAKNMNKTGMNETKTFKRHTINSEKLNLKETQKCTRNS
jgi:hypothetical protein